MKPYTNSYRGHKWTTRSSMAFRVGRQVTSHRQKVLMANANRAMKKAVRQRLRRDLRNQIAEKSC